MADAAAPGSDVSEEQAARIRRMIQGSDGFIVEQRKPMVEAQTPERDRALAPRSTVLSGTTAGAAFFGAGAAFAKLPGA